MEKSLSQMDKAYDKLNKQASIDEKMKYCATLIQKTERFIITNSETLAERVKRKSFEIIIAAEAEMSKLTKRNNIF